MHQKFIFNYLLVIWIPPQSKHLQMNMNQIWHLYTFGQDLDPRGLHLYIFTSHRTAQELSNASLK